MKSHVKSRKELLEEIEELRRLRAEAESAQAVAKRTEEALRASEMRFRSVAHSAVDAIISTNSNDQVVFWNPAAETIFGYSEAEILGKPVTTLIPKEFRKGHANGLKRYMATRKPVLIGRTAELRGLRKDGSEFPLELSLASWETSEGTFFTGIIRDICHRKDVERVLQQRTEEARQRTQELESLIQMVAHDLKSPVVSIGGFVRLLRRGIGDDCLDTRIEQILDQLGSTSSRLEQFLKDLLDGLAIEQSQPERIAFSLGDTVHDVVFHHKQAGEDKGIRLEVRIADAVPSVLGDQRRIRQVIDNIVGNAIRHMGENPAALIRIEVDYDQDIVMARISDNGVGIPAEYHTKIFDRFFRVPRRDSPGGTGLGLSIVKKIVESHGGKIWVESGEQGGADFVVHLPRSDSRESAGSAGEQ